MSSPPIILNTKFITGTQTYYMIHLGFLHHNITQPKNNNFESCPCQACVHQDRNLFRVHHVKGCHLTVLTIYLIGAQMVFWKAPQNVELCWSLKNVQSYHL